jgi:hypothetical protein
MRVAAMMGLLVMGSSRRGLRSPQSIPLLRRLALGQSPVQHRADCFHS